MRYIKSLIFVVAALCSFYFSHKCFDERAGSYVSEKTYGGDAYTGIQNAAAIAAKNAADVAEIVQKGFGYFFIVSGIILLGVAVPKDSLDKIKLPYDDYLKSSDDKNVMDASAEIFKQMGIPDRMAKRMAKRRIKKNGC